ncbi:YwqG family protein [Paenibacillus sp. 1-18]|uniref:YwqG family protein n=1 Tax=Paenibacillus sp. 1-18 TaxID=1333846 RepID=UPI0004700067|nr:YwqG family protein [Paenibacillus sp. 1-18]
MLQPPLKNELTRILEDHALDEQLKEVIYREAGAAIQFHIEHEENYERIGNSRIAGYPDLPPSIEWPCDSDGEYYTFIAQINLGEMPFSPFKGLPEQGILYFFLGVDEPAYDIDHKIFYYNGDSSALKKTLPPTGKVEVCAEDRDFTSCAISFQPILTVPSESETADILLDEHEELYELLCEHSDTVWGQHQSFAGNTRRDAYLCRNGLEGLLFNWHKSESQIHKEVEQAMHRGSTEYAEHLRSEVLPQLQEYQTNREMHDKASEDWHVLLSVSSLDEVGMCWWDAGYLEFFMDKKDLQNLDFTRTYVNLATS